MILSDVHPQMGAFDDTLLYGFGGVYENTL